MFTVKNQRDKRYFLKIISLCLFLFVFSCKSDIYKLEPSLVVIIKADDLGNMTTNWERFIDIVEKNNICAGIGIISSHVTEHNSIMEIKEIASKTLKNNEPIIEFWNHGFDHAGDKKQTEFWGTSKEYQVEHIRKSQQFFLDSLGIECETFSAPFNRTSAETYNALQNFPEIKILMTYRKSEIFDRKDWIEILRKQGTVRYDKIRLNIQEESVFDVPFNKVKRHITSIPSNGYLIVQVHPNVWDESDFSTFQEMIDYFKNKNVNFMTPKQYYKYLHNQ